MSEFDHLDFADCLIKKIEINSFRIIIAVDNLIQLETDPSDIPKEMRRINAKLIFENVISSVRIIHEYLGDPKKGNFKPSYTIHDGPFETHVQNTTTYLIEGIQENPIAWVDWNIKSQIFNLIEQSVHEH